jgi:hypothetical protein
MLCETEKLEFKAVATDEIYKEVIAFANTEGGTLLASFRPMLPYRKSGSICR